MDYQLELKQVVDYPRCRIYREFLHTLMKDKNIRTSGSSYLFYFMVLCSYANFRSSYRRLEGISYLLGPGEWICKTSELASWFRTRFQYQAVEILEFLQANHYISYTMLDRSRLVKFCIGGWKKNNTALEYNYPCLKDVGFFFFPIAVAHELISMGKCSEMDIVLDLWLHAIYNDEQVKGSEVGPVVYFRNYTGSPLTNYSDLALRWGISRATVSRLLNKLQEKEYLSLISFNGNHGSVIYLCSYLSTMFNISDVMIDKEEVSMILQVPVSVSDCEPVVNDEQITVSDKQDCVSKPHICRAIQKVAEILAAQGVPCCECANAQYIVIKAKQSLALSDCKKDIFRYSLKIQCPDQEVSYQFELAISPATPTIKNQISRKDRECYEQ